MPGSFRFKLAIVVLGVLAGFADGQRLPNRIYSTADGLANDYVEEIVRDSRGFLWFCTGEGLSRFDGYSFKNYTIADGLPHRTVNDFLELGDGNFLVGTSDGLAVFDPMGNPSDPMRPLFRVMRRDDPPYDKQPFRIHKLRKMPDGRILATTGWAIFILSKQGAEWQFEKLSFDQWDQSIEFTDALVDQRGNIWVGSSHGIWWVGPQADQPVKVSPIGPTMLLLDHEGKIWSGIGLEKGGLGVFGYDEATGRPIGKFSFSKADGLADDVWINDIFETSDNRIIVATGNGVSEFVPNAGKGEKSFVTFSDAKATAAGEDLGGNIWIGTATIGATRITRRGFEFYDIPEKPPYLSPTSVFKSVDGTLFLTSSSTELYRFNGRGFDGIVPGSFRSRSWGWGQLDLRSKIDGEWWIPGIDGLYRYPAVEFSELARTAPKRIYTTKDGLESDQVFNIFEDSRGDIWFSNTGSVAVSRWVRKEDRIERFTKSENAPDTSGSVAFGEDPAGNVWIGLYTGGVARFRNGRFDQFPAPAILPATMINQFHRDSSGRFWIAINSGGIVQVEDFEAPQPRFRRISIPEGLSSVQANCITEDKAGNIYVGTAKGINRIDRQTGRVRVFSQSDGLPGSNISRCAVDDAGDLWFAQRFTMVRMTPESDELSAPPAIYVSEIRANGENITKLSELGESSVNGIELGTDQRRIQISFFSLAFGTGESPSFQYRIDDGEWSDPTRERTIVLNQSPGSYRFELRAVNSKGTVSAVPAIVSFRIAFPIWQRWWFLLMLAFGIGSVVYLIYRYRVTRILELERVRTRIATDLHDDIGSSLSQIAILSEVARQRPGASEPLDMIAETSRETLDSMSDIVWAINPSKDSLHDLLQRMRRFASEVFDARDIIGRFDFPDVGTDASLGANTRREVYLMFKECVNNIAKHAAATEAEVKVRLENHRLSIGVSDNGKGFHVPASDIHETHEGFGGNGLVNLRQRAARLGGEVSIESAPGNGTTVTITVPLDRTRLF